MDQHEIDVMRNDTFKPQSNVDELNKLWAAYVRDQQDVSTQEQRRRDDSARHAAIIHTAETLARIKYLLSLLLLCTLLILLCTLLLLWKER
jgi:hypothetical protein